MEKEKLRKLQQGLAGAASGPRPFRVALSRVATQSLNEFEKSHDVVRRRLPHSMKIEEREAEVRRQKKQPTRRMSTVKKTPRQGSKKALKLGQWDSSKSQKQHGVDDVNAMLFRENAVDAAVSERDTENEDDHPDDAGTLAAARGATPESRNSSDIWQNATRTDPHQTQSVVQHPDFVHFQKLGQTRQERDLHFTSDLKQQVHRIYSKNRE